MSSKWTLIAGMLMWAWLAGCSRATWPPLSLQTLPSSRKDFPDAAEVYLLRSREVRFGLDENTGRAVADVVTHARWRLLDSRGQQPRTVFAAYTRGFSTLRSLRGRVLRPDGKHTELDGSKRVDGPVHSEDVLVSDDRVVYLPVPTLPSGAVLESESVVRFGEMKLYQFSEIFGEDIPVQEEVFSAWVPAGWALEWRVDGADAAGCQPEVVQEEGGTRYRWVKRNLAAWTEGRRVSEAALAPRVSVRLRRWTDKDGPQSGFANAQQLSAWLHGLAKGTDALTDTLRATAASLLAEAGPSPRARAERMHRFVCEAVEYCAVELGYGAWKPQPATDVLRLRYGDCKGKANLLRALLHVAGIESDLVLVYAHSGWPRPFGLPVVTGNFNHMVLRVKLPEGPVWVDPTQRSVPFGELPPSVAEADVLPLTAEGASVEQTPALLAEHNTSRIDVHAEVNARGGLSGRVEAAHAGAPASGLRESLLSEPPSAHRDTVAHWLRLPDLRLDGLAFSGEARGERTLTVRAEVTRKTPLRQSGDALVLTAAELFPAGVPTLRGENPALPVVKPFRWTQEARVVLTFPEGFTVSTLPSPLQVDGVWGSYRLEWAWRGRVLEGIRRFRLTERRIPPEQHAEARRFFESIHTGEARPLVVRSCTASLPVEPTR